MLASEIIDKITRAGGRIWLEEDKVRARLPETLRPLVSLIHSHKPELMAELARRPAMPAGVRLVRYAPVAPPVKLSQCETVVDTEKFIRTMLMQIDARLHDRNFLAGNWPLSELLARLAALGCRVALDNKKAMLQ